jgi:hypothetical protein
MAIDPVPDDAEASPVDGHWFDETTRWYKPTLSETARLLGWRWVLCLPLVALIGLLMVRPWLVWQMLIGGWKLILFAVAIPLTAFGSAARNVIRRRKDMFCIHCGYSLTGLPDGHRCPECGQPFSHALIDEYRRDPDFFVQRQKAIKTLPPVEQVPFEAGPVRRKRRSRDGT